ncbi:MAG TPA: hypothetical protein VH110_05205 [Candidatus Acidoferrum sp.]|jgi:hypothetical protein|nr:hypothetical protein [Candidatus Acidoferrum sp.]
MRFGEDENGAYKLLPDGRVLRAKRQIFNAILTLSKSRAEMTWREGW